MKKAPLGLALASLACMLSAAAPAMPAPGSGAAQVTPDMVQTGTDIPADWKPPQPGFDYSKREVMIPMRDGVKLLHRDHCDEESAQLTLPILLERERHTTPKLT